MPRDPMAPGPAAPRGSGDPEDASDPAATGRPEADPGPETDPSPVPSPVEEVLTLRMLVNRDRVAEVPTRFHYDAAEPYAVRLAFHVGEADEAEWVFARDLLHGGLSGPSGQGDIKVWPCRCPDHGAALRLALASPYGSALLEADAAGVEQWLERCRALVPPGDEVGGFPSDEDLARFAAG
jgi:hypothetical protein